MMMPDDDGGGDTDLSQIDLADYSLVLSGQSISPTTNVYATGYMYSGSSVLASKQFQLTKVGGEYVLAYPAQANAWLQSYGYGATSYSVKIGTGELMKTKENQNSHVSVHFMYRGIELANTRLPLQAVLHR